MGATGPGGIDFGFGENAIHVHIKNIRDQRNEQEPYDRLPDEMKAQVTQFLFLFLFLHEREKENRKVQVKEEEKEVEIEKISR